uniref:Uncharacterized protein LOC113784669 n=1 Tax=Cicer arietinum TaxID=3827 RepID=A0A3Q7Y769_CICAR|nr:uncharacterized protein LOC113784669 [Cicer arietinum]
MRNLGEDMKDKEIMEKILCTLSEKFTYVVCSIEESRDIDSLSFECPISEKQVNYVEFNEEEELVLIAHVEIQGAKMEDLWFLDSGCSNHMSGIKKWFSNLDETFRHSVNLENDARMMVHGNGNIKLKINYLIQIIKDVFYVTDLSNNLLSIRQLQERKLKIVIKDNTCKIYHSTKGLIMDTQ